MLKNFLFKDDNLELQQNTILNKTSLPNLTIFFLYFYGVMSHLKSSSAHPYSIVTALPNHKTYP